MQRKFVKAIVNMHQAGNTLQGEVVKLLLPWPVSAMSALVGVCRTIQSHRDGDYEAVEKGVMGIGMDVAGAIPGAHIALKGSGLILHAVKRVHCHFSEDAEPPADGDQDMPPLNPN